MIYLVWPRLPEVRSRFNTNQAKICVLVWSSVTENVGLNFKCLWLCSHSADIPSPNHFASKSSATKTQGPHSDVLTLQSSYPLPP